MATSEQIADIVLRNAQQRLATRTRLTSGGVVHFVPSTVYEDGGPAFLLVSIPGMAAKEFSTDVRVNWATLVSAGFPIAAAKEVAAIVGRIIATSKPRQEAQTHEVQQIGHDAPIEGDTL